MLKLRAYMVLHDDTIETLAEHIGMTRQTLSRRMNGHCEFKNKEILAIADKYNLGSDEIVEIFFKGDTA